MPIIPNRVKYKVKRQTLDKRNAHRLELGQVVFAGNVVVSREKALVLVSLGTPEELLRQVRQTYGSQATDLTGSDFTTTYVLRSICSADDGRGNNRGRKIGCSRPGLQERPTNKRAGEDRGRP
jgi:hypothetical protein